MRAIALDCIRIIGEERRPADAADAAFGRGTGQKIIGRESEFRIVDVLPQSRIASGHEMGGFSVEHVALVAPGIDHGPNLRHVALPLVLQHGDAGRLAEGFVEGAALALAVRPAPRHDRFLIRGGHRRRNQQRER